MFRLPMAGLLMSVAVAGPAAVAADFPAFAMREIDPQAGAICYAVTLADVNGDQRQDIVVVTERRVLCYQSPDWKLRVLIEDQTPRDNVCIAAADIDGDGQIDFAVGAGWTKTGTIHWISRGATDSGKWQVHAIGEELSLHRMRFADVLGTGRPQLVISPLSASNGNAGARLIAFEIPAQPRTDRWQPTVLDASLNRMHNHWHLDFDGNGSIDTLAVGREGVFVVRRSGDGWSRTQLGRGASSPMPDLNGAGEIRAGRFKDGSPFIATVEPMHGESLVVYTPPTRPNSGPAPLWDRHVLDSSMKRGHALGTADLDGDGQDEIVVGHSDPGSGAVKGPGVSAFQFQGPLDAGWRRHVLEDGGVATEDLAIGDLTGDGHPDVVAVGRATHNVRLYVHPGR